VDWQPLMVWGHPITYDCYVSLKLLALSPFDKHTPGRYVGFPAYLPTSVIPCWPAETITKNSDDETSFTLHAVYDFRQNSNTIWRELSKVRIVLSKASVSIPDEYWPVIALQRYRCQLCFQEIFVENHQCTCHACINHYGAPLIALSVLNALISLNNWFLILTSYFWIESKELLFWKICGHLIICTLLLKPVIWSAIAFSATGTRLKRQRQ